MLKPSKTTITGRLFDYLPAIQNIPIRTEAGRRIRDAMYGSGWRMRIDYSSLEFKIMDRAEEGFGFR